MDTRCNIAFKKGFLFQVEIRKKNTETIVYVRLIDIDNKKAASDKLTIPNNKLPSCWRLEFKNGK